MIPHFPAALKAFAAHVADPQRLGKQQKLEIVRERKNIVILDGDTVALTTPRKYTRQPGFVVVRNVRSTVLSFSGY
jgi:hypothetical protein